MVYHIRLKEQEITDINIIKKILTSTRHVTIAMCKGNEPYLATLSHGYDAEHNCIYFHCATEGKKLDYLSTNRKVWGQALIDEGFIDGECNQHYSSVQFRGDVSFPSNEEDKIRALACMIRQQNKNTQPMLTKLEELDPKTGLRNVLIGRIDIEYFSGKRSKKET